MSIPGLVNLRARAHANLLLSQPSQRRDMIARRRTVRTRNSAYFGNGQIYAIVVPIMAEWSCITIVVCTGYLYVEDKGPINVPGMTESSASGPGRRHGVLWQPALASKEVSTSTEDDGRHSTNN
jgi:hypothetical protein